ncbi:hypothetical protein F2Q69_00061698 [Brassica cretica]|uniref:Uncharacterized protein n=1 Tax=Brassica cretica TaxID=69181 RepID=A0A8S9RKW1_BRACR|nr:hypothetical protein F2Q69_00061698 [Brassica cretica]
MNESTHDEHCGAESGRIENQKVSDTIVESFKLVTEEMKRERRVCYEGFNVYVPPSCSTSLMCIDPLPPSSPSPVINSDISEPLSPSDSEMIDLSSPDPLSFILALRAPFHDRPISSILPTIPATTPPSTSFNPFIPTPPFL